MYRQVDLVIIGASFAGLMCAKTAAELGLEVVLLEQKKSVMTNLHTTGVLTKEAASEIDFPKHLLNPITKARIYSPNLKSINVNAKDYFFYATDTAGVLSHLYFEAINVGVEIRFDSVFDSAHEQSDGIFIPSHQLKANYLIGADGAKSRVARSFNLGINKKFLLGVEAEFENLQSIPENCFHCFLDKKIAPGYLSWVIPSVGVTQVGLASLAPNKPKISELLTKLASLYDITNAGVVERRGGLIPIGGVVEPFYRNRVILVGDAAGMVSPLTAGGIQLAFQYGKLTAVSIKHCFEDEQNSPGELIKQQLPNFYWKHKMRQMFERYSYDWLLNRALSSVFMNKIAKNIIFHES